jgi:hypothetical protein
MPDLDLKTFLPNGYCVSTVSLRVAVWGAPRPYETMVFPADGKEVTSFLELAAERYDTEIKARAGHHAMVAKWTTMPPWDEKETTNA